MSHATGVHLGFEGLHRHARADLGLEWPAPGGGVDHPGHLHMIHSLANRRQEEGQGVHDESGIHARAQYGLARAFRRGVDLCRLLGMSQPGERELLGRRNDVQPSLQDLDDLVLEQIEIGAGGMDHDVGPAPFQCPGQGLRHGNPQGLFQPNDLSYIPAGFGRVNVHAADQLQARALYQMACYGTADGTKPVLNDSDFV